MHAGKLKVFRPERGWNGGGKVKVSPGENNRLTWKERPDATTNKLSHQFPLQRMQGFTRQHSICKDFHRYKLELLNVVIQLVTAKILRF